MASYLILFCCCFSNRPKLKPLLAFNDLPFLTPCVRRTMCFVISFVLRVELNNFPWEVNNRDVSVLSEGTLNIEIINLVLPREHCRMHLGRAWELLRNGRSTVHWQKLKYLNFPFIILDLSSSYACKTSHTRWKQQLTSFRQITSRFIWFKITN